MGFACASMLLAVSLIYTLYSAYRHLHPFIILGFCLFAYYGFEENKKALTKIFIALVIWIDFILGSYGLENVDNSENLAIIEIGREQLDGAMKLDKEASPWDNTVLCLHYDGDGNEVWWRGMYAFPDGAAINLCKSSYLVNHYDDLKARYIYTNSSDSNNEFYQEKGAVCIAEYGSVRVWKIR